MVVPSKSYSSTSSPSDSALDTPPQTTNFDHGTLRTDSRLSASLLVDHVVCKSNDNLTLPISTDVAARRATNRASTPSICEDDPGGDRVSLTSSDGEVGIGLSFLEDFTRGGEDGGDWSDSSGVMVMWGTAGASRGLRIRRVHMGKRSSWWARPRKDPRPRSQLRVLI